MVWGPRVRTLIVALLLVASGAASLAHQAVWLRRLFPVVGAGVLSAAIVSAGALLGLALGAAWGGRLADRRSRPGHVFAGAELVAAVSALLLLVVTDLLAGLATALASPRATPGLDLADVFLLLLALVGCTLAAIPMGATLPAALRAVAPRRDGTGVAFRLLYAANTVGAVGGVLWAGGFGLEALGNRGTALVAAGVQAAVGLVAWLALAQRQRPRNATPVATGGGAPVVPRALCVAAALAGGAGLAAQVAWMRRLAPVVGNTTQAFTAVLATYLLGIALGSFFLGPRRGRGETVGPVVVLVLAALPLGLLPDLILPLARWVGEAYGRSDGSALAVLGIHALAAGLVLVPSTVLGAAALPWLVRAGDVEAERVGEASGRLLAWNTGGSALFAILTGAFALPWLGSRGVLLASAGLYLLGAACVARGRLTRIALPVLALLCFLWPTLHDEPDDALFEAVGASFSTAALPGERAVRRFAREGRLATVVVRDREDQHELWVDSKIVASSQFTDRMHLALLGHLPMALHPDPRRVAIVGLGTGMTARAVAAWKPERLDVFELEPAVAEAARWFERYDGGLPKEAQLWFGDGRRQLARSEQRYDVITSDPIHPGVAGAAALYSLEYYELLRERAALVCQWLPLYQMSLDDARLVVRTFEAAFANTYVFLSGPDALLVGTQSPLALDEGALRTRLAALPKTSLLGRLGFDKPGILLGLLVRMPPRVTSFADPRFVTRGDARGPLNRDDQLLLEFRCGRNWFLYDQLDPLIRLISMGRSTADELLGGPPSTAFRAEMDIATQVHRALRVLHGEDHERTVGEMGDWLALQPDSELAYAMLQEARIASAQILHEQGKHDEALPLVEALEAAPKLEWTWRLDLAELWIEQGQGARALPHIDAAEQRFDWPRIRRLREALGD